MAPILVIDLFTMLDTQPLTKALKAQISCDVSDDKAQSVVEMWRRLQVEYMLRLNAMSACQAPFPSLFLAEIIEMIADSGP